jgi:F-type H+-transporting ATPase subunit a
MEHHVSWLTHFVNQILGAPALALLTALHIKPNYTDTPIPEHVVMALTVLVVGTVLALALRARLSVERPGASQQIAEMLLTNPVGFGINDVLEENAGHRWKDYVPMVGSVALFILLANLFGAFPFLSSPTANVTVPLACAIITFLYFNWQGLRHHGPLRYAKTFTGGVHWSLWLLIVPVEIISTTARVLSLTVRLWANIFASDLIYGLFLGLFTGLAVWAGTKSAIAGIVLGVFPALAPIAFIILHVFVSVVQTYVFAILPAVYIGLATADQH